MVQEITDKAILRSRKKYAVASLVPELGDLRPSGGGRGPKL